MSNEYTDQLEKRLEALRAENTRLRLALDAALSAGKPAQPLRHIPQWDPTPIRPTCQPLGEVIGGQMIHLSNRTNG